MSRATDRNLSASPWPGRIALLVMAAFALATVRYAWGLGSRAEVGRPAPNFELPTLSGEPRALASLRGSVVLLNFWASWCPPCREEAPALEAFAQRYGDRVAVWGINEREGLGAVEAFRREFGLTYPTWLDSSGRVAERYGLRALPESWMIDAQGVARVYHIGAVTFEDLMAAYEETTGQPIDGEGVGPVPAGGRVVGLAVTADRLLLATAAGVFAAPLDAPLTSPTAWTSLGPGPEVLDLAVRSGAGGVELYAATVDGLWRAELGGEAGPRWQPAGWPGQTVAAVAAHPSDGALLAWLPGQGLRHHSAADGWSTLAAPFPADSRAVTLAADPRGPDRWLAGAGATFWRSQDGGRNWQRVMLSQPLHDLVAAEGAVYLATGRGLWISRDGVVVEPLPAHARSFRAVAAGPGGLWAAADNGDLYRFEGGRWRYVGERR